MGRIEAIIPVPVIYKAAVREVHEQYRGEVPNTPAEISKLKGVGPYTTGAILSIAYGVPQPAVDGNVMRVLSRILSVWDDIAKPKTRKLFEDIVHEIISKDNPSYFNQGMMELGAIILYTNFSFLFVMSSSRTLPCDLKKSAERASC